VAKARKICSWGTAAETTASTQPAPVKIHPNRTCVTGPKPCSSCSCWRGHQILQRSIAIPGVILATPLSPATASPSPARTRHRSRGPRAAVARVRPGRNACEVLSCGLDWGCGFGDHTSFTPVRCPWGRGYAGLWPTCQ
jgi:hypothetical protein